VRILLVGHACSPRRGTELAFTWNWALHLAQMHEVWVVAHPQERWAVEEFLTAHPNKNLHFEWVSLPSWLDPWAPVHDNDTRGLRLHYLLWQKVALRRASQIYRQIGFDIAHHVSWGTVSEPSPLWRLPVPFVWGPLGGGQVAPPAFKEYFGSAWRGERLRRARMRWVPYRPTLRKAIRRSALILSTNHETYRILKQAGAHSVVPFLDSGLSNSFISQMPPMPRKGTPFTLLWVGQLEPRKCLPLALQAIAQARDLPVSLLVAGQGSLRQEWERLANRLGLRERVRFLGQVPYVQMSQLYRSADAFIFTSLRDAFGSQVLEAMAAGLPVITLDHQGVGAFVPSEAAIKAPVVNPTETVSALAGAIKHLACNEESRVRMGVAAWEFAKTQTWSCRARMMTRLYESVLNDRKAGSGVRQEERPLEPVVFPGFTVSPSGEDKRQGARMSTGATPLSKPNPARESNLTQTKVVDYGVENPARSSGASRKRDALLAGPAELEDMRGRVASALHTSPGSVSIESHHVGTSGWVLRCTGKAAGTRFFAKTLLVDPYPIPARFATPWEDLAGPEKLERPVEEHIAAEWNRVQDVRRLVGCKNLPTPLGCSIDDRTLVFEEVNGLRLDRFANWVWPGARRARSMEGALYQAGEWLRSVHKSSSHGCVTIELTEVLEALRSLIRSKQLESTPYADWALKAFERLNLDLGPHTSVHIPVALNHGDFSLPNLIWDRDCEQLWVVDFELAARKAILHDLCTMVFVLRKPLLYPLTSQFVVRLFEGAFWAGYGAISEDLFAWVNALVTARLFYHTLPRLRAWRERKGRWAGIKASLYAQMFQPFLIQRILRSK
jgi:glycosyltransferase involved in cell wall biosynthesis